MLIFRTLGNVGSDNLKQGSKDVSITLLTNKSTKTFGRFAKNNTILFSLFCFLPLPVQNFDFRFGMSSNQTVNTHDTDCKSFFRKPYN